MAAKMVLVRADGGSSIGGGHIVRAKIICDALKAGGDCPSLLTKDDPWTRSALAGSDWPVSYLRSGENESLVTAQAVRRLSARVVVLDVRDTSPEYVRYLKETGASVVTIDDDGRGAWEAAATFRGGVRPRRDKNFYYGPDYAILSPQILTLRASSVPPQGLARVVCFLGTFDPRGHGRLIPILAEAFPKITFLWFTSAKIPPRPNLQILDASQEAFFRELLAADVAIVSGGVTLFEAAALGRPSVVLPQAPHEVEHGKMFADAGSALVFEKPSPETLREAVESLISRPSRLGDLHRQSLKFVDGRGLERFLQVLRSLE